MLVEKSIFAVCMCAVEKSVSINDVIPEAFWLVEMEGVCARLEVVLVSLDINFL